MADGAGAGRVPILWTWPGVCVPGKSLEEALKVEYEGQEGAQSRASAHRLWVSTEARGLVQSWGLGVVACKCLSFLLCKVGIRSGHLGEPSGGCSARGLAYRGHCVSTAIATAAPCLLTFSSAGPGGGREPATQHCSPSLAQVRRDGAVPLKTQIRPCLTD